MDIIDFKGYLVIFLFILFAASSIVNGKKADSQAIILLLYFLIQAATEQYKINVDLPKHEYLAEYINIERAMIRLDGAFSLIFTIFLPINNKAKYQALLLCCAVFIHSMLIYHLKEQHSFLSSFIYDYCDELIIVIWLTMTVIARDGLIRAFNKILLLLRSRYVHHIRNNQNLFRK